MLRTATARDRRRRWFGGSAPARPPSSRRCSTRCGRPASRMSSVVGTDVPAAALMLLALGLLVAWGGAGRRGGARLRRRSWASAAYVRAVALPLSTLCRVRLLGLSRRGRTTLAPGRAAHRAARRPRRWWCCCRGRCATGASTARSTSPTTTAASPRSSAPTPTPRGRTRARSTACSRMSPAAPCSTSRTGETDEPPYAIAPRLDALRAALRAGAGGAEGRAGCSASSATCSTGRSAAPACWSARPSAGSRRACDAANDARRRFGTALCALFAAGLALAIAERRWRAAGAGPVPAGAGRDLQRLLRRAALPDADRDDGVSVGGVRAAAALDRRARGCRRRRARAERARGGAAGAGRAGRGGAVRGDAGDQRRGRAAARGASLGGDGLDRRWTRAPGEVASPRRRARPFAGLGRAERRAARAGRTPRSRSRPRSWSRDLPAGRYRVEGEVEGSIWQAARCASSSPETSDVSDPLPRPRGRGPERADLASGALAGPSP